MRLHSKLPHPFSRRKCVSLCCLLTEKIVDLGADIRFMVVLRVIEKVDSSEKDIECLALAVFPEGLRCQLDLSECR